MARFKPGVSGNPRGRGKGTPNVVTGELRDMIVGALADAGGRAYLAEQAKESPAAFIHLIAKLLPRAIHLDASVDVANAIVERLRVARESTE
jgi:hypothetical protein